MDADGRSEKLSQCGGRVKRHKGGSALGRHCVALFKSVEASVVGFPNLKQLPSTGVSVAVAYSCPEASYAQRLVERYERHSQESKIKRILMLQAFYLFQMVSLFPPLCTSYQGKTSSPNRGGVFTFPAIQRFFRPIGARLQTLPLFVKLT